MDSMLQLATRTSMTVLVRLHREAKEVREDADAWHQRGQAIKFILNQFESDFGLEAMLVLFVKVSKHLGETLNPVDTSILVKLVDNGFQVKGVTKALHYSTRQNA